MNNILQAPQRMRDLDIKEENEENRSFGKPQRLKDLEIKEENEENRSLGMPQRANHSKNVSFPMPQRANNSKNISVTVTPASPSRLAHRSHSTPPPISRRSPVKIQKLQRQPQPQQQLSQQSHHLQPEYRQPISRRSPVEIQHQPQQQPQPHQQLSQQQQQLEHPQPISRRSPVEIQQQQPQPQRQHSQQQQIVIVNGKSYLKGEKVGTGGSCVVYKVYILKITIYIIQWILHIHISIFLIL